MVFLPKEYTDVVQPAIKERPGEKIWTPMYWHDCTFPPEVFRQVMLNLVRNPNINSNHLFRADVLFDCPFTHDLEYDLQEKPKILQVDSFDLETVIVTKLIPRNPLVDKPLDQTCLIYNRIADTEQQSLFLYTPHVSCSEDIPFYYPAVRHIGFLHTFDTTSQSGTISIHYSFFESVPRTKLLERTALHLLTPVHKHGQGTAAGYQKRVHHDAVIPQARLQNTYARLKSKYAKILIDAWVEVTDPGKHVFEDLGIAAFLIELWADLYAEGKAFPGFVDIGCGNGLLVHILLAEGYEGWGFDARRRKSWETYSAKAQKQLKELVLIPAIIQKQVRNSEHVITAEHIGNASGPGIHSGEFPKGTFIISNHADELTPWTPILATLSESPFIAIPCCSHNLTGGKFRAPAKVQAGVTNSAFASLVIWVTNLAVECGWEVEKEMLRIPSTRNTALIGRRRTASSDGIVIEDIIARYGGADGWEENAMKLIKGGLRGH